MRRSFKYRLFTNANQERELSVALESHRRLYNACLDYRQLAYEQYGASINSYDCSRWFKVQRKSNPYFARLNFSSAQGTMRRLDKSFASFFRRVKQGAAKPGYPRFKGRDFFDSIEYPMYRNGIRLTGNRLHVQHAGTIRVKLHRPVEGAIKTVTLKREAGKWFVIFSCELPDVAVADNGLPAIGIDLGLTHFLTDSEGVTEPNPRFFKTVMPELRRVQRSVSRKRRGGSNRRKEVRRLQKVHARIANLRREHHHQVARRLVRRSSMIAVESLNVKGMLRNHWLARSISDAGWSGFIGILKHQASKAGVQVVEVDPRGTSQTCTCGQKVPKELSDRWHECPACGLSQQRDHVSAQVILARGLVARTAPLGPRRATEPCPKKPSPSGDGVVTCDECGEEYETDPGVDFKEAWEQAKEDGWLAYKESGEWKHKCEDCKS